MNSVILAGHRIWVQIVSIPLGMLIAGEYAPVRRPANLLAHRR
jgi:hypothetical protein